MPHARNVDAATAVLAADVVMLNPATDDPIVGTEAVGAALRATKEACDEFRHTHLWQTCRGEAVYGLAFEARVRTATLRGVDLIEINDPDQISRLKS